MESTFIKYIFLFNLYHENQNTSIKWVSDVLVFAYGETFSQYYEKRKLIPYSNSF